MRRGVRALLGGLAAVCLIGCQASSGLGTETTALCRVLYIGDGDSMRVDCGSGPLELRLHCIDAPELGQGRWGWASRDELRRIAPDDVRLKVIETDRYGRQVALVNAPRGERSLNLSLVQTGHAAVYRRYCRDRRFYAAEEEARLERLGIWSQEGSHQRPWDYRH